MRQFTCDFRRHDLHHLEMKTTLPIPEKGRARFDLNFYFFTPAQLHITKENFSRKKVLKQIQTYTRFSSPALTLEGLIDTACELSPLCRIQQSITNIGTGTPLDDKEMIYELQTLVNAFRSNIKGFIDLIEKLVIEEKGAVTPYKERIQQVIEQTNTLLECIRALYPEFLSPQVSDTLRTALEWTDETITLIAEQQAINLRSICETDKQLGDQLETIQTFIENVGAYRAQRKYTSVYNENKTRSGERVAYRESVLKKWSQSALYMKNHESHMPKRINHILAGTAAALAMAFAVLAAAFADTTFVRYSVPWVLIIILSYVFKDRIKEILRGVFGKLIPRILADRIVRLIEPKTGRDVANAEEIISYGIDKKQPTNIREARDITGNPFHSILPPQDVLHYNRIIRLKSSILRNHKRLESLTEITRVRIDEWLKSMDDPEEITYNMVNGEKVRVANNRVYHIHLIASLREYRKHKTPRIFHYCLIMNRTGLLRIEER